MSLKRKFTTCLYSAMRVIYLIYQINNNIFHHFLTLNICGQMMPVRDKCLSFSVITVGITVNKLFKIHKWHLTADIFPNVLHKSFWKKGGFHMSHQGHESIKWDVTIHWNLLLNGRETPTQGWREDSREERKQFLREEMLVHPEDRSVTTSLPPNKDRQPLPWALRFSAWLEI